MGDSIARYRSASTANDAEGLRGTLAADVELVSPLSGRMVFRGRDDVMVLIEAVYGTVRDLEWEREIGGGDVRVLYGETRIGPLKMTDAMVLELAQDGSIRRIRPHLRPWLAVTLLAIVLGGKVSRHPGVMLRAWRRS